MAYSLSESPTDTGYIDALLGSVEWAYKRLLDECAEDVRHLKQRRRISNERCQDIIQESALKILKGIATYNSEYPFEPWRKTVVNRVAIDIKRKADVERAILFTDLTREIEDAKNIADIFTDSKAKEPYEIAGTQGEIEKMQEKMSLLPVEYREILTTYHLQLGGNGHVKNAARILQIPEGTVKSREHAARLMLVELMDAT